MSTSTILESINSAPAILALDTSTEACSVALCYQDNIYSDFTLSNRDHAQQILPMIDRLLKQANCQLNQIDAIAFAQGPGSFTGIRIGVAIAQGLGFGLNKPLIPVSTLLILAQGAYRLTGKTHVLSAIDARMNEIYFGAFSLGENETWHSIIPACVIAPELAFAQLQLTKELIQEDRLNSPFWAYAGTGFETYPNINPNQAIHKKSDIALLLPESQDLLTLAKQAYKQGQFTDAENAEPLYLRNEVTWKKLEGR